MVPWVLVVSMATPCITAILLQFQPGTAEASRTREPLIRSLQGWADSWCDEPDCKGIWGLEEDYCNEGSVLVTWIVNLHCFGEADSAQWGQSTLSPKEATWDEPDIRCTLNGL